MKGAGTSFNEAAPKRGRKAVRTACTAHKALRRFNEAAPKRGRKAVCTGSSWPHE